MLRGNKGSDVFASTGDPRVDLSIRIVRDADEADLRDRMRAVIEKDLADAAVLMFHSRNIRGGKGERDIGRTLFLALQEKHPELARVLLPLIPHYGSWRDLFAMLDSCVAKSAELDEKLYAPLRAHIVTLVAKQLLEDEKVEAGKTISLCGKWAPREGQSGANEIAQMLFPTVKTFSSRMRLYRKLIATLNRRLKTVEVAMCGGAWASIKPEAVPGRAGKLYAKAFLNVDKKGELRHPDNVDRMECRAHFKEHLERVKEGSAKMNGVATVFPHEIVRDILQPDLGSEVRDRLNLLWTSIVETVKAGGGLSRSVFMSDFSGSMQSAGRSGDTPYLVSMALGILGAQITTGRFMTFDSTPRWHTLSSGDLVTCINDIIRSGVGLGLSTDFQAAMDLILADIKGRRVRPGEEPENLIVLTDMNWDQAAGSSERSVYTGASYRHHVKYAPWETHIEMIRESFKRAGEDMWGVPFQMPRIVIWNLAANPTDIHAQAETPGVIHLSGWSPTQFKVLQAGGIRPITPLESLRVELDDPQYDRIRDVVREYLASPLRSFQRPSSSVRLSPDSRTAAPAEDAICSAASGYADAVCAQRLSQSFQGHADGWGAVDPDSKSLRP